MAALPYIGEVTHLDLTDDEKRSSGYRPSPHHRRSPYPLSPRFLTLKAILAKLKTGARAPGLAAADAGNRPAGRNPGATKAAHSMKSQNKRTAGQYPRYHEQSVFDWRRYSHWETSAEKARLAAFVLWQYIGARELAELTRELGYATEDARLAIREGFRRESAVALELIVKAVIAKQFELERRRRWRCVTRGAVTAVV